MAAKDWLGITEKTLKASDDLTEESLKDLRRSLDRSFAKISRDMVRVYKDLEGADPVYIQAELSKIKQANIARQILSPAEAARFEQEFQQLLEQQTAEGLKYGDLMVQATSNPPELIQQFGVVNVEAAAKEARDARQYLQKYSNEAADKIIGAVSDNLLRGGSVASLSRDLRGILGTTKAHADTMAQNETLRSLNTAARDRYKEYGVQYVQILALVDKVTTPWCRYRHMKIISIKEKMPPYHHRCRTVTAPVDPSWLSKEDLKWMANESARAKNLGLSSPGKAPFDDGKMNFITPSTFAKKETMLAKAEKPQAIAPVVEKKAVPLKDSLFDFKVESETKILAPLQASKTPFGDPNYDVKDFIAYKSKQLLVKANSDRWAFSTKKEITGAIAAGIVPHDSALAKLKITKKLQQQIDENKKVLDEAKSIVSKTEEILNKKSVPNIAQWKPTMTREEASKYFGKDNYFGEQSFWHGNSTDVTKSIRTEGGQSERNVRGIYGKGVYAGSSKGIGLSYGNPYSHISGSTELLEMRIYSKNPYIVDSGTMRELMDEMEASGFDNDVRVLLKSKGFDSIYVKDTGYIVAFDKEQISVVDSVPLDKNMAKNSVFANADQQISFFQSELETAPSSKANLTEEYQAVSDDDDFF